MCDERAVSDEHAPPKCFFPKVKDVGVNLRSNLITVPSCDEHNSSKSRDDEYAMMFVVTHYETNSVARNQFSTKCIRALKHSRGLTSVVFKKPRKIRVGRQPSFAVTVDRARFDRVIEHTCRALFFHELRRKFTERLFVWSPAFRHPNLEPDTQESELGYHARQVLQSQPRLGKNAQVFWYQIFEKAGALTAFRLMFYEGCSVYAVAMPEVS
jgi:hypothetical protein